MNINPTDSANPRAFPGRHQRRAPRDKMSSAEELLHTYNCSAFEKSFTRSSSANTPRLRTPAASGLMNSSTPKKQAVAAAEQSDEAPPTADDHRWILGPVVGSFLGNSLLLGVGFLLMLIWNLFEDFREPLMWGLWCSIVLRGAKDYLVSVLGNLLSSRSLILLASLPAELVWNILCTIWTDSMFLILSWSAAMDKKAAHKRATIRVRKLAEKMKAEAPDTDDDEYCDCVETASGEYLDNIKGVYQRSMDIINWCTECGMLSVDSASELIKHKKVQLATLKEIERPSDTGMLFGLLLSTCVLFETYRMVRSVVGLTILAVSWSFVTMAVIGYVALRVVEGYLAREPALDAVLKKFNFSKLKAFWQTSTNKAKSFFKTSILPAKLALEKLDDPIRKGLVENLDSLVAIFLCLCVLLGTFFGVIFFSIQIGSELHGAASMAMSVEVNMGNVSRAGMASYVPEWVWEQVEDGKLQAAEVAKENLPKITQMFEEQMHNLVDNYNLTETVAEMYIMYATLQQLPCSPEEDYQFSVEAAKANAKEREAFLAKEAAKANLTQAENSLTDAVGRWTTLANLTMPMLPIGNVSDANMSEAEVAVVKGDNAVHLWTKELHEAEERLGKAEGVANLANKKLKRCQDAASSAESGASALISGDMLIRFKAVLSLALQFQFSAAYTELMVTIQDLVVHVQGLVETRDLTSGVDTGKLADPLASFGGAVVAPLAELGKSIGTALLSSIGSSTSMLMSGGASIVSTVMGAIQASISFISFVGLLYYLLSQDEDPIDSALAALPVAPDSRVTIDRAVRTALSGVFEVMAKLAFFHGVFTWLTLRMVGCHFVYLPTLGAIFFSAIPIAPVIAVAIPGVLELMFQGAWVRMVFLLVCHLGAGTGTSIIQLGVPGTNSFLTGMAIAGGMATFEDAFQGALLGPLIVSLVCMLQTLATEFSSKANSDGNGGTKQVVASAGQEKPESNGNDVAASDSLSGATDTNALPSPIEAIREPSSSMQEMQAMSMAD